MKWILRFFPDIIRNLEAAESARIKAEDEVRFWRGRADWAESDRDKARMDLAGALKQISNWQSTMAGVPVPFPEVSTITPQRAPGEEAFQPPRESVTRSLRDLQREAVAKSRHAAFERRQETMNESRSNS